MLDQEQLTTLYRTYRGQPVLSIYLDADQRAFGDRSAWRVALKSLASDERRKAGNADAFDRAFERLKKSLDPDPQSFLTGRGWVGFATPDEVLLSEDIPTPMPDLVRWETGPRVAPYVRALKQSRPVLAVLVDSRHARILHYREGELTGHTAHHADTFIGDLTDVNVSKRAQAHSGVRGATGTDSAQRILEVERDRLVGRVAAELHEAAGADGLVVLGGASRSVQALREQIADWAGDRLWEASSLNFDMSDAEIRHVVEQGASELSAGEGHRMVEELFERAGPDGRGCLGEEETEKALREMRVDTLLVSDSVRKRDPDRIDHFEGAAFEQGASVVEVKSERTPKLDEQAGGVGALVRYLIRNGG